MARNVSLQAGYVMEIETVEMAVMRAVVLVIG